MESTSRASVRQHWERLNQPRTVDGWAFWLACCTLLAGYSIILLRRPTVGHPEFLVLRLLVWFHALLGVVFGRRFSWAGVRYYTVVLALLLPLVSLYINGTLGHGQSELPLTVVAIFVPLVFLQTGWDCVVVGAGLWLCNTLLLRGLPPPLVSAATVTLAVHSATAASLVACLTLLAYRSRLHVSMQALERALRAKNEFLNTMSHELRSPLHVIVGYAGMLGEDAAPLAPQALGNRIRLSALELLQLVENTMNAARLEAGKVTLHVEEFPPQEVLGDLAECVRALPEAKSGVPVEWQVRSDLPAVRLDRLKLKEIIQNLVSNALKFTREGKVSVRVDREGEQLRIDVLDTGRGIAPDAQARIFDVFERVEDPGSAHRPVGVGLGLYIVRSLVRLMQGRIELASQPGAGTCFTVRLPLRLDVVAPS